MYIRKYTGRFVAVFLSLIILLLFFTGRLVYIQVFRSSYLAKLAERQHNQSIKIEPVRGVILDRNLRPLAMNVPVYSLYANPRRMSPEAKERAVRSLPEVMDLNRDFIRSRLDRDKFFIWIARKLPLDQAEAVRALEIPGLSFIKEARRYYPNQHLAAHVLGFAGMDNTGLEGLELQFDDVLRGRDGSALVLRDARQQQLMLDHGLIPPQDGFSLVLTLDETIQYIAEEALDKAYRENNAKWASIIVMNPNTGEILALANRPTYDLNDFGESSVASRTNRAIAHVYEPGSVFKIVAAAAALEEDAFHEDDEIFCENGRYRVGSRILHDHHPHGKLTFKEVIEQSSNIGTTKIAQKLGPQIFYKYVKRFNFGELTGIDLRGEVAGMLKPPSRWSKTTISAMPIGHEVAATPLQLVCAVSAVANGGTYLRPFVVKYIKDKHDELIRSFEPREIDRVISPSTAERVKKILQGVVDRGTGRRAQIAGIGIGGKTGTSQKIVDGRYSHSKYYASFIGFAPVDHPRIAAVVMFDEPHPNHYGGTVAAPAFREMLAGTLQYLEAKGAF
ncbi:MAG: peptidoglycan D,D-transpeptidase FtsI family protein [Candidatus Omnitrophota bacterium]